VRIGGVRTVNTAAEVFAPNVRQFYLDCYIASENFMTVLMTQLRYTTWVSCTQFVQSLEEIQTRTLDQLVLYLGESHSYKKASTIQKLVCNGHAVFFRFNELLEQQDLTILELRVAVGMSLRGRKNFSEEMVTNAMARILERLAEFSRDRGGRVSFRDFYFVLRHKARLQTGSFRGEQAGDTRGAETVGKQTR
jgi:hypothetical protein